VLPADGQSVHPAPAPDPARPPLLLPRTDGLAIDDPDTALLQQIRVRLLNGRLVSVLIVGAFVAYAILSPQVVSSALTGFLVLLIVPSSAYLLWLHEPQRRRGKALLGRYGWRGVPATLVADKPCLVRIVLDERELTLRLRRMNWMGRQRLLRTGTLWICGPDERGRALGRYAGSVGDALADVTGAAPTGVPPILVHPSGPRPADDPVLIWYERGYRRGLLIMMAILVLLIGVGAGLLSRTDDEEFTRNLLAALAPVATVLIVIVYSAIARYQQFRRFAAATHWQAVPVSLDTWEATGRSLGVRTGTGRIILPGGWRCYVEFPRLPLDLAANLRATGVLWLAGDAAPGETVPFGLPGYALRGVVKIKQ
jgi:hypothetical protein